MRSATLFVVLVLHCVSSAFGWGYIFSRFRPEATSNWGYGGVGLRTPEERLTPREQLMEALMGEELLEEEVCNGRRCTSNEHCCPGHVCMNFDGTSGGNCMPIDTPRTIMECTSDMDCHEGHVCELGTCMSSSDKKGYSEPCMTSSECDTGRRLCCQVVRRHRQAPRKLCTYFTDPMTCMGHLEAQEKRSRPKQ